MADTSFKVEATTGIKDVNADEAAKKATFKYFKDGSVKIKKGNQEFNAIGGRTK
jgi:hypothetical protein